MQTIASTNFYIGMLVVSLLGMLILVKPTRRKKKNTAEPVAEPVAETPAEEAVEEAVEEAAEETAEEAESSPAEKE